MDIHNAVGYCYGTGIDQAILHTSQQGHKVQFELTILWGVYCRYFGEDQAHNDRTGQGLKVMFAHDG